MFKTILTAIAIVYALGFLAYALVLLASYWDSGWSIDIVLLNAFQRSLLWPVKLVEHFI